MALLSAAKLKKPRVLVSSWMLCSGTFVRARFLTCLHVGHFGACITKKILCLRFFCGFKISLILL